jgi:Cys-rich repeat protein
MSSGSLSPALRVACTWALPLLVALSCADENARISLLDDPGPSGGSAGSAEAGNQGGSAGTDATGGAAGTKNPDGARCFDSDDCESRRCVAFTCVPCAGDGECGMNYSFCNTSKGRCQQCVTAAQCPAGEVCTAETGSCSIRCLEDPDCAGSSRPICARSSGVCVECALSDQCVAPRPLCEPRSGRCVECLSNADCGGRLCEVGEYHCENHF